MGNQAWLPAYNFKIPRLRLGFPSEITKRPCYAVATHWFPVWGNQVSSTESWYKELPADFCNKTGQFEFNPTGGEHGQGNHTDFCTGNEGQPWCVCDWSYLSYRASGGKLEVDCAATTCAGLIEECGGIDHTAGA